MPPRRASRRWAVRSRCAGSRAAEPVADVAVLTIEPGPAFVARLHQALDAAPNANRYVIHILPSNRGVAPSPLAGESRGGGDSVAVAARPVSDTCKEVIDGLVRRTLPRDSLATVSGPWLFTREALTDALARVEGRERVITGLVPLCEAARLKVRVVLDE